MPQNSLLSELRLPSPYAAQLVSELATGDHFKKWPKGTKFAFIRAGEPVCHFFRAGVVNVERIDDGLSLGIASAPLALGFTSSLTSRLILRAYESCEVATLSHEQVMTLIEEKQIWDIVAKHMLIVMNKLFTCNEMVTAPTSYDMLCYQLQALIQEPDSVRQKTAVWQYIQNRTRLSRSSIMKMLSALKEGGYIRLEQGKLAAITHLPPRF